MFARHPAKVVGIPQYGTSHAGEATATVLIKVLEQALQLVSKCITVTASRGLALSSGRAAAAVPRRAFQAGARPTNIRYIKADLERSHIAAAIFQEKPMSSK